jgi:hypothetical protein
LSADRNLHPEPSNPRNVGGHALQRRG